MARVPVLKPLSGELVYVEEADLRAAKRDGFKEATPQEVAQVELGEKYGGVGSTTGAAVAGVLRGATLGGSDILASGLGLGERLKAYQELEPGVSTAAEIAGAVAPIAISALATAPAGGAGGAATAGALAARIAARTPAALAMRAGERAVAGLGLTAAEGVAQGVGRTAFRFGVQGGVESALQGGGREAGQLALDNKLNGEHLGQIAVAALTGGAFGLGIGSGIGAGAGLLGKIGARGAAAVANEVTEGIRPSAWAKAQARVQKFGAKVRGADPEFASQYVGREVVKDATEEMAEALGQAVPPRAPVGSVGAPVASVVSDVETAAAVKQAANATTEAEQMAARIASAEDMEEAAAKELVKLNGKSTAGLKIREEFDDFLAGEELADLATRSSSLKADILIAGNVAPEQLAAQRAWAGDMILEFDDVIRTIEADKLGYSQQPVKKLKAILARTERSYYAALELPADEQSRELYKIFDRELKSHMGQVTSGMKRGAPTPDGHQTIDALTEFYKKPQKGLENVPMWGEIGNVQKNMNPHISEAITRKNAFMDDWYGSKIRRKNPADPWRGLPLSDPRKIEQIVKNAVSPYGSVEERTLGEYITHKREYYKILEEYGDWTGKEGRLAAVKGQLSRLERMADRFEELKQFQRAKNFEVPQGTGVSRGIEAIPGVGTVKAVVSAALNPKLIAGAFRGAEAILSPAAARTVESVAETQSAAVGSGVARAMRSIAAAAVDTTARAARVGVVAQYEDKSKRVRDLGEQVPAITARIERDTQWLQGAPTARGEAVATAVRQIDYLNANLPQGLRAPTPFSQDLPATRAQVQGWLVRLRTVENPASLLDDVANGKLSPEAVDAVKTVYPAMFADMQARVVQKLAKLQAEGRAPNVATRTQLGLLLGIPTDPLLLPASMRAIQSIYPPPAAAGPSGAPLPAHRGPPPNIAKNYQSGSERIALTSELK